MSHDRPDLVLCNQLVVDVQLEWSDALAVLTHPLLGELDADDVLSRGWGGRRDPVLGWDAEEVVDVGDLAVLDQQGMAAEPGAVGEDDAFGARLEIDLGERLVRHVVHVGSRTLRDLQVPG